MRVLIFLALSFAASPSAWARDAVASLPNANGVTEALKFIKSNGVAGSQDKYNLVACDTLNPSKCRNIFEGLSGTEKDTIISTLRVQDKSFGQLTTLGGAFTGLAVGARSCPGQLDLACAIAGFFMGGAAGAAAGEKADQAFFPQTPVKVAMRERKNLISTGLTSSAPVTVSGTSDELINTIASTASKAGIH